VRYTGSDSFEQQIVIDSEAGSAPNVAVFPQPALAATLARRGFLTPLRDGTADWVRDNYAAGQSWVDLGTYADQNGENQLFAFAYKVDLKSLVWYVPENFEDAGYEVPTTMEELQALTEQIVADGETPWCIGLGSGGATGWPATDWVEDLMLRIHPPEVYDEWVSNAMPFNDPRVIEAIEDLRLVPAGRLRRGRPRRGRGDGLPRQPARALLGAAAVLHAPPGLVHPVVLPRRDLGGRGRGLLLLPGLRREGPRHAGSRRGHPLGHHERERGRARPHRVPQDPEAHEIWMARLGFLTPHSGVDLDAFGDPTLRQMNEILLEATTFRFDASDLMPPAVGQGSFWTGMVDYAGGASAQAVADEIQRSWPQ
jgi:alpha-glucoside transport system substrate-binding protein